MKALAMVLALLVLPQGDPQTLPAGDPQPAADSLPEMPRSELLRGADPVAGGLLLERNGGVTGCLFDTGQGLEHSLEARAGELVLLDLFSAGYARGWTASAHLSVIGPDGTVVLDRTRRGGVEFATFTGFRAPSSGEYKVKVAAREGGFRYTLVRHADFAARRPGDPLRELGDRSRVFDYLLHDGDEVSFTFEAEAGENLALRVESPVEKAVEAERKRKFEEGPLGVATGDAGAMRMGGSSMAGPSMRGGSMMGGGSSMRGPANPRERAVRDRGAAVGRSWPLLRLQILDPEGKPVGAPGHYLRFAAKQAGTYTVKVDSSEEGQGGLLQLDLLRSPELVHITGHVADGDGAPLGGLRMTFLREPDLDLEGRVQVREDGTYSARLRPGPYSIVVRGENVPPEILRTHVEAGEELNLLLTPGP